MLLFLMITCQGDDFQVLEKKAFQDFKIGQSWRNICISKSQINNLQLQVFLNKGSEKGSRGACSQKEAHLKFNQAEGNVKAILINKDVFSFFLTLL